MTVGLLVSTSARSAAEMRALLIGVTEYPMPDKGLQLRGPVNDVRLMRELLLAPPRNFSEEEIRVLADGVDGAELPTEAAILAALD